MTAELTGIQRMTTLEVLGAPEGVEAYQISTPGLGDHSYLITSGGRSALIDPQRDLDRFEAGLAEVSAPLAMIMETHVHNDYVSGGRAMAQRHGATHVLPADAGYTFDHHAVRDEDEIRFGDLTIRALHTPGHTPHHTSYAVLDGDTPLLVFSGGSVLVASCGRTDLVSPEMTEQLTRSQYRSAQRLLSMPKSMMIGPTHGAGSFCAASAASADTYTDVGTELTRNPAALARDEQDFVDTQLAGLLAYPSYYSQMAGLNKDGAEGWEPSELPALGLDDIALMLEQDTVVIDGRPRAEFAHAHAPGSVNIEMDEQFSTYVGWLFPFGTEFAVILPEGTDPMEPVRQCARIGITSIVGYLEGGFEAWEKDGRETRSYDVIDVEALRKAQEDGARVLDVRQDLEWSDGHVPDAVHIHIPDVPERADELKGDQGAVHVMCRTGHRASIAASILDSRGVPAVLVNGGFPDWAEHGYPVDGSSD